MRGADLFETGLLVVDLERAMADLPLEAAGANASERAPALFAFRRGDHGLRVELVDCAMRPSFEGWLAGGALDLP